MALYISLPLSMRYRSSVKTAERSREHESHNTLQLRAHFQPTFFEPRLHSSNQLGHDLCLLLVSIVLLDIDVLEFVHVFPNRHLILVQSSGFELGRATLLFSNHFSEETGDH